MPPGAVPCSGVRRKNDGVVTTADVMDLFGLSYISAYRLLKKLEDAGKLRREGNGPSSRYVLDDCARESKFFHHLSIILSCKNSLFTCKNYCKMVKDVHETGKLCSM